MSISASPPTGWEFEITDPAELVLGEHEFTIPDPQIQVSTSPISLNDGLGIKFCQQDDFPELESVARPNETTSSSQEEIQRKRINRHIYELLQTEDKRRERQKRFDDLGASPRKRARLAARMEELLDEEIEVPDLSAGSDLLKLQMIALSAHEQEKERLLSIINSLEKEIKKLVHLNIQQSERRMWMVREVLRGRATDLQNHSQFLMSLVEGELA
ncbi:hypothetical protein CLCR_10730 [Cladophialophora carrionii]|uniref:Uncharacterized protein n=1 Tax=Cladophialophora carrionii TaxID=86049 RepID=A0A1C1CWA4_9EURO|nr:hypothetical protein CLCR_10730 [Cladophialophora carrionii]